MLYLVNPLPVTFYVPWPWTNQYTQNRDATERDNNYREKQKAEKVDGGEVGIFQSYYSAPCKAQQPSTTYADVSNPDPSCIS